MLTLGSLYLTIQKWAKRTWDTVVKTTHYQLPLQQLQNKQLERLREIWTLVRWGLNPNLWTTSWHANHYAMPLLSISVNLFIFVFLPSAYFSILLIICFRVIYAAQNIDWKKIIWLINPNCQHYVMFLHFTAHNQKKVLGKTYKYGL